jgi:hypothetical protein
MSWDYSVPQELGLFHPTRTGIIPSRRNWDYSIPQELGLFHPAGTGIIPYQVQKVVILAHRTIKNRYPINS